ncbi:hypothetical protein SDC9_137931 [bioreactor metagenome]|uniref:Uncharacterized protein n=1 Tax=bioreactor metagenome TaxID=1076179 RepID=A0A645DNF5_9ZZZZ
MVGLDIGQSLLRALVPFRKQDRANLELRNEQHLTGGMLLSIWVTGSKQHTIALHSTEIGRLKVADQHYLLILKLLCGIVRNN